MNFLGNYRILLHHDWVLMHCYYNHLQLSDLELLSFFDYLLLMELCSYHIQHLNYSDSFHTLVVGHFHKRFMVIIFLHCNYDRPRKNYYNFIVGVKAVPFHYYYYILHFFLTKNFSLHLAPYFIHQEDHYLIMFHQHFWDDYFHIFSLHEAALLFQAINAFYLPNRSQQRQPSHL